MGKQGIVAEAVRRVQERLAIGPPRRIAPGTPTPRIAIIGSGFGGIGMGIQLKRAGIESFTIYEKADRVGGTWRDNTYPGAACDVPSHLYSFSFAANVDWTRKFPEQPEILAYLEDCVDRFDIADHLRFGAELAEATFDEDAATWRLLFVDGTTVEADVLVAATGQLNRPHVPDIAGLDDFAGHQFHSARWDHDHDLTERDVAVIGVGASAIQFVPEIAKQAPVGHPLPAIEQLRRPQARRADLRSGPGAHAPLHGGRAGLPRLDLGALRRPLRHLQVGFPRRPGMSSAASRRASRRWCRPS